MKHIFSILILATVLSSCERDMSTEGPSLFDIYGDFSVKQALDVSNRSVDFAAGETTTFTAEFSKSVNWELTITGNTSKAKKVITGFSKELDYETALWDGSTTVFPMFKQEACSVELFIPSDSVTLTETLAVKTVKTNEGFLISDFETGINPNWDNFFQSGVNFSTSTDGAPQGNSFYNMSGTCGWDWLIGMVNIPASAYGSPTFVELPENGDKVYFNVLLNLPEGITNAKLLIRFKEDDNNDGVFSDGIEDEYTLWFDDLDYGWQQISVKYSDLLAGGENAAEPKGNGVHNPNLLSIIDILLLADPSTGFSQVDMDYMIFTENEPLNP
jgi:hypothetical protein